MDNNPSNYRMIVPAFARVKRRVGFTKPTLIARKKARRAHAKRVRRQQRRYR